jgi:hypothetical protein
MDFGSLFLLFIDLMAAIGMVLVVLVVYKSMDFGSLWCDRWISMA